MARDEPFNAADSADLKHAAKLARQSEREDEDTIRSIMATSAGRAWMYRKLVRCHIYTNPYAQSDRDTAFQCGEMNIGQMLLAEVDRTCPDTYLLMMREANDRIIAADTARNNASRKHDHDDDNAAFDRNAVDYSAEVAAGSTNGTGQG